MRRITRSRQPVTAVAVALAALAVALAGPAVASAGPLAKPESAGSGKEKGPPPSAVGNDRGNAKAGSGEGIVQSVSAAWVVLRALDGSATSVPVSNATHVFVDGRRAALADVEPGFVALAVWKAG